VVLPAAKTLAEIRQAVGIRLGMGQQVGQSTALHPMLDEHIRTACSLLQREAEWAVLDTILDEDTATGQRLYDIPDRMHPGDIREVSVVDVDGREHSVHSGVAIHERNAYGGEEQAALPLRWEMEQGAIALYPMPDAERYPTLRIRGQALGYEPYHDSDRVLVDSQAVILQATVLAKQHFDLPNPAAEAAVLGRHLVNLRAAQSDGETIQIGPEPSRRYPSQRARPTHRRGWRPATWDDFD
jgi:hypothetical protein